MPDAYADTIAPYPERAEDATAIALARHLACQVQTDIATMFDACWRDPDRQREYRLLSGRTCGYFGALMLLRALIEHAPDKANQVAVELWKVWEHAPATPDLVHDWLVEYGIDAERVILEAEPAR